uniref:Uncharacterized protein n=1 Tax=uncultured crenarchaeote MCG TaxID=529375 RepID=B2YI66_9CREN|nr:hypothetical protein [uncultured crenarchaeote MCG]
MLADLSYSNFLDKMILIACTFAKSIVKQEKIPTFYLLELWLIQKSLITAKV